MVAWCSAKTKHQRETVVYKAEEFLSNSFFDDSLCVHFIFFLVFQAPGGHLGDPVLSQQVCAHHRHPGQLW